MGFFIGPIVGFFNNHVSNRLVGISGDIFAVAESSSDLTRDTLVGFR